MTVTDMGMVEEEDSDTETEVKIPNKSRSLRARSVQKRLQTELNKVGKGK